MLLSRQRGVSLCLIRFWCVAEGIQAVDYTPRLPERITPRRQPKQQHNKDAAHGGHGNRCGRRECCFNEAYSGVYWERCGTSGERHRRGYGSWLSKISTAPNFMISPIRCAAVKAIFFHRWNGSSGVLEWHTSSMHLLAIKTRTYYQDDLKLHGINLKEGVNGFLLRRIPIRCTVQRLNNVGVDVLLLVSFEKPHKASTNSTPPRWATKRSFQHDTSNKIASQHDIDITLNRHLVKSTQDAGQW